MSASWKALALIALIAVNSPVRSEPAPPAKKGDPNEIICERVKLAGSRVGARKVCGTRAQWTELRRREREIANQAQRGANNACQSVAMYPMAPGC